MTQPVAPSAGELLKLGAAQALLFVAGALLGRWVGLLLGFDALRPGDWGLGEMAGIALIGLGGGGGVQLARAWHARKHAPPRG